MSLSIKLNEEILQSYDIVERTEYYKIKEGEILQLKIFLYLKNL